MNNVPNLDDNNQSAFYIPYAGKAQLTTATLDEDENDANISLPSSSYHERDLRGGEQLRFEAYRETWRKCLGRVQSIIHALYAPVVADVVKQVHSSYDNVLPGLPYPEVPVISITNPASDSTFLNEVTAQIDCTNLENEDAPSFTTHLYPTDCLNIMSTMKAVVTGFVERLDILERVKRRPTTSLASYDIGRLIAWYTAVCKVHELHEHAKLKLVVLLHDFEQLDPIVVQDLFYICSLHVPRLPLVFILSLSSLSSPSYLHIAYPRSTLALLRVRNFVVPSGPKVLEEVLLKTFFDINFDPDIVIGPAFLVFLTDYFIRQNASLDSILTILQLAHLKHFSGEPLTLLVQTTPSSNTLSHTSSFPFLDGLLTRLHTSNPPEADGTDWSQQTLPRILVAVDEARIEFYHRARRVRIGFGIIKLVQEFLTQQGHKGLNWDRHSERTPVLDVMIDVMRGKVGSNVKVLGSIVRKLKTDQLSSLLEAVHAYLHSMPSEVKAREENARARLVLAINALPKQVGEDMSNGTWLVEYVNELIIPLEEAKLWDIWYTGLTPFPLDLINPSVRASILSGMLRPHEFTEPENEDEDSADPQLWELPDTSILFRRYLDSGKIINVYDWFESFQYVLETQRKHLTKESVGEQGSPKKRSGKGKGKQIQHDAEKEEGEEEKWKMEVQARFMRALQELDYLGFIKHTGRKADHVQRTVFDIPD